VCMSIRPHIFLLAEYRLITNVHHSVHSDVQFSKITLCFEKVLAYVPMRISKVVFQLFLNREIR